MWKARLSATVSVPPRPVSHPPTSINKNLTQTPTGKQHPPDRNSTIVGEMNPFIFKDFGLDYQ
jgi:hypothetical protein